jgi:DNA-binding NtrC family response regulator
VVLEDGAVLGEGSVILRGERGAPPGPGAAPAAAEGPPPSLAEVERAYLEGLLQRAGGNKSQVARWMGVSYPTVQKKIADYGLEAGRGTGDGEPAGS